MKWFIGWHPTEVGIGWLFHAGDEEEARGMLFEMLDSDDRFENPELLGNNLKIDELEKAGYASYFLGCEIIVADQGEEGEDNGED